jgi:hypothetical protein
MRVIYIHTFLHNSREKVYEDTTTISYPVASLSSQCMESSSIIPLNVKVQPQLANSVILEYDKLYILLTSNVVQKYILNCLADNKQFRLHKEILQNVSILWLRGAMSISVNSCCVQFVDFSIKLIFYNI